MKATGWLPDFPDWRDWDALTLLVRLKLGGDSQKDGLPAKVDMRKHCSPIEAQGRLGSCVAQAIVGMVEYMERRHYERHIDASRLFLYKIARQLDGLVGDTGAYIRTGMKALRLFGCPPERYWPYRVEDFDAVPDAFAFAYGQNLQALSYYRIDTGGRLRSESLELMKRFIAASYPSVLGYSVYNWGLDNGDIPMPEPGQRRLGGHAVMVCGYDDERVIGRSKGALLIRNSWGTRWGDGGYGWLPYDYILEYLSRDFWCLLRKESFVR